MYFITDVIAALEVDNFNSSAPSCFNVKTFIHSNCIPGVLDSNSAYKPLGVLVGIEFSQFGPKGNILMYVCTQVGINTYVHVHTYKHNTKAVLPLNTISISDSS